MKIGMNNGNISSALTLGVEALLGGLQPHSLSFSQQVKLRTGKCMWGRGKKNRILVWSMDKPYTDIGNFK